MKKMSLRDRDSLKRLRNLSVKKLLDLKERSLMRRDAVKKLLTLRMPERGLSLKRRKEQRLKKEKLKLPSKLILVS